MQTATLAEIRMRPKHQVTLPASIVRRANFQVDDRLCVDFVNDTIIIKRKDSKPAKPAKPIMSYAGIGSSLWGNTTTEVEATIRDLRSSWER